jgi:hypothetical protein
MNLRTHTIEQVADFVTIHAALPPDVLKWTVATARKEGHKDVSQVICRALEFLKHRSTESRASLRRR